MNNHRLKFKPALSSFVWSLLLAALSGCGGREGTLTISILVPVGGDPFAEATQARIAVGDPVVAETTVPVQGGHFDASIEIELPTGAIVGQVVVEALGTGGVLVGRGRTPLLGIQAADEAVTVWVGRPGRAGLSAATLTKPRLAPAIGGVPRLGAVVAGGTREGQPVTDTDVYFAYTHSVVPAAALPAARTGGAVIGVDRSSATTGVALYAGGGATSSQPSAELLAFDPVASGTTAGRWVTLATDASLARTGAAAAQLPSGDWLIAGGISAAGAKLPSASIISIGTDLRARPSAAMLSTGRSGHLVVPGKFGGDDGALVIGGAAGAPLIERYSAASDSFTPVPGNLDIGLADFTATRLPDGRVVVAGGSVTGVPRASGFVVAPDLKVEERTQLLLQPRAGHAAFVAGGEYVVCGGATTGGQLLATCAVHDAVTLGHVRDVPLAAGRAGLAAVPIDTGDVLLVGGTTPSGGGSTALELYTPR